MLLHLKCDQTVVPVLLQLVELQQLVEEKDEQVGRLQSAVNEQIQKGERLQCKLTGAEGRSVAAAPLPSRNFHLLLWPHNKAG